MARAQLYSERVIDRETLDQKILSLNRRWKQTDTQDRQKREKISDIILGPGEGWISYVLFGEDWPGRRRKRETRRAASLGPTRQDKDDRQLQISFFYFYFFKSKSS